MISQTSMSSIKLVLGAGGFIGSHLVRRLKEEGYKVRGVDLKYPEFSATWADDFIQGDLRDPKVCRLAFEGCDEVYQLAADMGGMGYISGDYDAAIMHNSALINLNVLALLPKKIFYSSSACIYPKYNQTDPNNPKCNEDSAYPADPDSEYGWEKLFSERLYLAHARNLGITVRIARLHNVYGPEGTYQGGREKAPAALCRKVAESDMVEIWGDGQQTRSFMYIDHCIEGIIRLMDSDFSGPVNIGSTEMVSIDDLALTIAEIAGKKITLKHIKGPQGVRGRVSDNKLIQEKLNWQPGISLRQGVVPTYKWVYDQVKIR